MQTASAPLSAEWLVARAPGTTASQLAAGVEALIASGAIGPGAHLPTIRDVAQAASVSVGTVAEAWSQLRDGGLVDTRRRGGTTVLAPERPARRAFSGWAGVDLLLCSPDVTLQPPLDDALLSSLSDPSLNAWGRDYMTGRLREAVEPAWPFAAEAWSTAGGGTEALFLATAAAAPPGSTIAVDQPLAPGYLDTLRDLGITPIGVEADADGPLPSSLLAALDHDPVAFVHQPGAPFAVRHRLTAERVAELADVLGARPVWVIEDDSVGPLAASVPPTVGTAMPDRVLRIQTYCKAYGTDLRTSVLGGARELVERTRQVRSHGLGSNSRILQNALAHMIGDRSVARTVANAAAVYESRKAALLGALEAEGLTASSGERSLVVWVEVPDETDAALALAGRGVAVGTGSKSFVSPPEPGLLRLSVAQLPDDPGPVAELARLVARAAGGSLREYFD